MYFVFNPISIFIVSFFGSVQFFSLFWIFIVYFFYFLGIENYCAYRKIELSRNHLLLFVFLSIFGFILFTQVSEIIKQAVATSVFFYGFSLLLLKKKLSALIVIIVSIGIHSSVLLFIPILFYKCLNSFMQWLTKRNAFFLAFFFIDCCCFFSYFDGYSIISFSIVTRFNSVACPCLALWFLFFWD